MKKKILSTLLLCSLLMTGCSKLVKIIDILLEEETEVTETETPGQTETETPEQTETETPEQTDVPEETDAPKETEAPAEKPETPEQPVVPDTPEQPGTEENIPPEPESFAGHWECLYTDADGNELMLYLSMTDDGRASYSYGYGNSEMAEIFGGWWGIADAFMVFNFTGGVQELELGYVPEPYDFESVYDY